VPWKVTTNMSVKHDFVVEAVKDATNMSALCRAYGISRKTGYKWVARYQAEGEAGLEERSRRPQRSPGQTRAELEAAIVAARQAHPAWGGRKLKAWLESQGQREVPMPSTITALLRRQGLLDREEGPKHTPYQRFERASPNELWQMDFKGHFGLGNGQRCHALTVLDDHSRFLVGLRACPDETQVTVQTHLTDLFRQCGLPAWMLMDNGAPWGDDAETRQTRLTVWLLRLGIGVSHGRPYHPQTQGKDERLHRTLHAEVLRWVSPYDLLDCQACFDPWRTLYNTQRPHEALGLQPPSARYLPSPRPFPETLPPLSYPPDDCLRKVDHYGKISFRNRPWRVGRAFGGQQVALRPDALQDGLFHVFFGDFEIHSLNLKDSLC